MSQPWAGLLSERAGELYVRLVRSAGAPLGEGRGRVSPTDPALAELHTAGLVWESAGGRVQPIWADLGLGHLLVRRQQELVGRHYELLTEYERLWRQTVPSSSTSASPTSASPTSAGSALVDVLTSPARVAATARDLQAALSGDYRSLGIVRADPSTPSAPGEGRRRMICTADQLTGGASFVAADEECRVLEALPIRMVIADDVALIMLTPTGAEAAMIVRSPVLLAGQAHYFDLLWERAVPITGAAEWREGDEPLPKTRRMILGMLMAGLTDAAIAHTLGISARSVRRHVAAMEERAGVTSRFALGVEAVRLGLHGLLLREKRGPYQAPLLQDLLWRRQGLLELDERGLRGRDVPLLTTNRRAGADPSARHQQTPTPADADTQQTKDVDTMIALLWAALAVVALVALLALAMVLALAQRLRTDCGSCVEQVPALRQLDPAAGPPPLVVVIGDPLERAEMVGALGEHAVVIEEDHHGALAEAFEIHAFPAILLVRQGVVHKAGHGLTTVLRSAREPAAI